MENIMLSGKCQGILNQLKCGIPEHGFDLIL